MSAENRPGPIRRGAELGVLVHHTIEAIGWFGAGLPVVIGGVIAFWAKLSGEYGGPSIAVLGLAAMTFVFGLVLLVRLAFRRAATNREQKGGTELMPRTGVHPHGDPLKAHVVREVEALRKREAKLTEDLRYSDANIASLSAEKARFAATIRECETWAANATTRYDAARDYALRTRASFFAFGYSLGFKRNVANIPGQSVPPNPPAPPGYDQLDSGSMFQKTIGEQPPNLDPLPPHPVLPENQDARRATTSSNFQT